MRWPDLSSFRNPANYALACLSELAGPAIHVATVLRGGAKPRPSREWRRAILWGAGHIGDVLYNTGSLPALQRGLPECAWFHAAPPLAAGALAGNPHLAGTCDPRDLASRIGEFDAVVCYNSGASWRETIAAWRWKVPNRAAYVHKGFSALATHSIPIRRPQSYPAYFRDLVSHLTGLSPDWPLRPLVYPGAAHEREASDLWQHLELGARPVVAAFITSRQASGVWPAERFGESLRVLHERLDCETLLLGSAEDEPALQATRERLGLASRVVAGKLSLLGLVCFLRRCRVVLATDSGPRHLANAAGVPVCFVPNLAVAKIETGAYLDTETDLAPDLESVPAAGQAAAFASIDPRRVAEIVAATLT
jgi:ADP-heptose:LPS heptosyltransferase